MTLDLAKIKSDAEIIASRCDTLLMPLPVKDVLGMLAEIECFDEGMRNIASFLGAGGYNDPNLSAAALVEKVSWGVGYVCDIHESQLNNLKAENDALRDVMAAVIAEIPNAKNVQPGNSPGHSHRVPGIWDEDNGPKAGNECGWCKVWNYAVSIAKERP